MIRDIITNVFDCSFSRNEWGNDVIMKIERIDDLQVDHKNDEEDREFENNGNQPLEQIGQLFAAG